MCTLIFQKTATHLFLKITTKENYENIWKDYFDFEKDYTEICNTLKQDKLIAPTVDEYYGIRILNQDAGRLCAHSLSASKTTLKELKGLLTVCAKPMVMKSATAFILSRPAERLSKLTVEDFEAARHRLQSEIP